MAAGRGMSGSAFVVKGGAKQIQLQQAWSLPIYSYGWSFLLAVAGFLAAEFSAALCLTAFLNKLESEVGYFFSVENECFIKKFKMTF